MKNMENKMPVLFVGHGSPMNAIEDNEFVRVWKDIVAKMPKPEAILCISAHWLTEGSAVTAMEKPKTIHDFYGFPDELYKMEYKVKGSPDIAKKIQKIVKAAKIESDYEWGLDHGTWSVLINMYPKADVPVLQLSLDYSISLEKAFRIGKELSELRKHGILIIGSGNIVHNLMMMDFSGEPYPWALDFDRFVAESLEKKDFSSLINYAKHPSAIMAHPTNDHYLPLIYVIGASENQQPKFFNEKIQYSSLSMRCVMYG